MNEHYPFASSYGGDPDNEPPQPKDDLRVLCLSCQGEGGYQMLDRPEPGFWRRCSACQGTGLKQ